MERNGSNPAPIRGGYTLRNPVPLRTADDVRTTRVGIPQDVALTVTGPVDHDSLAKAIRRSVGHDGMRAEDARAIAAHVLNFFGFNERIIDNVLEPDDRDTFYMLEDTGILETERDETTLYDGREWRIHYWMFRKDRIFDLAREESQAMAEAGEKDIVYSTNADRPPAPDGGPPGAEAARGPRRITLGTSPATVNPPAGRWPRAKVPPIGP